MKGFLRHVLRLLVSSLLLFVAVLTVLFLLLEIAPGDPVQSLIGETPVTEEYREQLTATFGLDRPAWERYLIYLANVFQGDLGVSFGTEQPVLDLVLARIGNTLALALPSFVLSTLGGILIGSIAARTRSRLLDGALTSGAVALFSIPNFWLGMMLITVFSVSLGWLPSQGTSPQGTEQIAIQYLVLPVFTMATSEMAYKARIMRSSMIESLGQDFIETARSKGISSGRLLWRHALPNALLPMVTVAGYSLGFSFAGAVLIERVYGWPGMGLLLYDAIERQNNMLVLGIVVVITVGILVINFITDAVYGLVDPRLRGRLSGTGRW
jgi:peptide/nickel transport system permease protein